MLIAGCVLATSVIAFQPAEPGKSLPGQPIDDRKPAAVPAPSPDPAGTEPVPVPPPPIPATNARPMVVVPSPHPVITEVLYAVPSGIEGDANKDGKRDAAGDEFIELFNPHPQPIQLFGYTLTDSQDPGKGQLKFTFPALELPPGGVVVVFNGLNSVWTGPIGDSKAPPPSPNENFNSAWVFTMKNSNAKIALGNSGDQVLLTAPDGAKVQRIRWSEGGSETPVPTATPAADPGKPPTPPAAPPMPARKPGDPLLDEFVPAVQKCSIQRDSVFTTGRFGPHTEADRRAFSPGLFRAPVAPK